MPAEESQTVPQHAKPERNDNKLLGLEVIRFICAVSVLFFHYQHFSFIADEPADFVKERQPFYSAFSLIYDFGYFGVPIFWCISGFIFFWKYKESIADRIVGQRKFFILRFSRLYPLHFVTLLLVAALQLSYFSLNGYYFVFQKNDFLHFFLQLFLASNWGSLTTKGDSFNGPIWSISIEVLIYCFFFFALRYVGRSALINIAILSACIIAKLAKVPSPIIDCLAYFYIGGLSAIALQHFERTKYRNILNVLAIFVVFAEPALILRTRIYENKHFAFLFLMTYVPILLYICAQNIAVHPAVKRTIEAAGNMTYSSYLIHFPIQLAIASFCAYTNRSIPYDSLAFFFGFFSFTLLVSYYIYGFFEIPAQAYIRRRYK